MEMGMIYQQIIRQIMVVLRLPPQKEIHSLYLQIQVLVKHYLRHIRKLCGSRKVLLLDLELMPG